jgi:hypothetical protein
MHRRPELSNKQERNTKLNAFLGNKRDKIIVIIFLLNIGEGKRGCFLE